MYLGSVDPGQECLNPKYRTSSIQVQIPVPGRKRTISPVPLLDLQAVPMKDTEGAVVTFEFSVFQIHKTEMYINRFLKITYIEHISNLILLHST